MWNCVHEVQTSTALPPREGLMTPPGFANVHGPSQLSLHKTTIPHASDSEAESEEAVEPL